MELKSSFLFSLSHGVAVAVAVVVVGVVGVIYTMSDTCLACAMQQEQRYNWYRKIYPANFLFPKY